MNCLTRHLENDSNKSFAIRFAKRCLLIWLLLNGKTLGVLSLYVFDPEIMQTIGCTADCDGKVVRFMFFLAGHAPNQFGFLLLCLPVVGTLTWLVVTYLIDYCKHQALACPDNDIKTLYINVQNYHVAVLLGGAALAALVTCADWSSRDGFVDLPDMAPREAYEGIQKNSEVFERLLLFSGKDRDNVLVVLQNTLHDAKSCPVGPSFPSPLDVGLTVGTGDLKDGLSARYNKPFPSAELLRSAAILRCLYQPLRPRTANSMMDFLALRALGWLSVLVSFFIGWSLVLAGLVIFLIRQSHRKVQAADDIRECAYLCVVSVGIFSLWVPAYYYAQAEIQIVYPEFDAGNPAIWAIVMCAAVLPLIYIAFSKQSDLMAAFQTILPGVVGLFTSIVALANPFALRGTLGSGQKEVGVLLSTVVFLLLVYFAVFATAPTGSGPRLGFKHPGGDRKDAVADQRAR